MGHISPLVAWSLRTEAVIRTVALLGGGDGLAVTSCRLALGACLALGAWIAGALRQARASRVPSPALALAEASAHGS